MAILTKNEDKPNSKYISKIFFNKRLLCGKKCDFGMFSGGKGDYIDVWMIKVKVPMKRNFLFFHMKERKK